MTVRDGARGAGRTVARVRIVLPEALHELAGGRAVVEVGVGAETGAVGSGRAGVGAETDAVGSGRAGVGADAGAGVRRSGSGAGVRGPGADVPRTVGGVLGALSASHPGLYDRLMTEQGLLRPHVNLFVDGENIRFTGGLGTRVEERSEIFVLPAISGG